MSNEQFEKLCATFGFAPSRSLRELLDAAVAQRDALLEALKWIADVNATDYEYQAKARAAIAKAEGEKT